MPTYARRHRSGPARRTYMQPTGDGSVFRADSLAQLYEGVFTAIVRLQSGKQHIEDPKVFRTRILDAFSEIARSATKRGFQAEDVQETKFALMAFLDEAILTSQQAARAQWAQKTLMDEVFNTRSAGELFFEHLERLRSHRDSPELAQVLEVYYLCLLLGYEGKYAVGSKADLHLLMDALRERLDGALGPNRAMSRHGRLPAEPPRATHSDRMPERLKRAAIWAGAGAAALFIVMWMTVYWRAESLLALASGVAR